MPRDLPRADAKASGRRPTPALTIGIDLGGTFVDCVVAGGTEVAIGKALATRPDAIPGILEALEGAARDAGMPLGQLLASAADVAHGTTLGLNALLTRTGGTVGLLTTRGHEDALLIGRVHQKVAGLRPQELTRASELRKPEPLVPRWRIRGIDERVDSAGREVVVLDEAGVAGATRDLVGQGCDTIAIGFLWSFRNPDHERRAARIAVDTCPGIPIVISSDVAPVLGEYERTAATVVNAFLTRPFGGYVERLGDELRRRGFTGNLWLMGMTGGLSPAATASARPVDSLRSGPVGGVVAAGLVGERLGHHGVIAADMGGTSFDVGLIVGGRPEHAEQAIVGQLHLAIPTVDVRSIGAGGGSIAWLDEQDGLHVGPRSAGSHPGPACYGLGGTEATVTDADVVLGRLDPEAVLGDRILIQPNEAETAIRRLADRLGVDVVSAASGIVRVADAQMADLIRTVTVERGRDPREFLLVAYGGAGPLHVGRFGAEIGVLEAVVPPAASVLSALGLAVADYSRTYRRSRRLAVPLDREVLADLFAELEAEAASDFEATGIPGTMAIERWVEFRYRRQTHQLRVPLPRVRRGADQLEELVAAFEARYEQTYGRGTAYAAAGIEATAFGLIAAAPRAGARGTAPTTEASGDIATEPAGRRSVYFDRWIETPAYRGASLGPGTAIAGPAVIDWRTTTLVVHPGQSVAFGRSGDARLRLGPPAAG